MTPEQNTRLTIDAAPEEAGWILQNRDTMNLAAAAGVAVREFKMTSGHGFADYLLFVNGKAVGVLEAKPAGYALTNVARFAINSPTDPQVLSSLASRLSRLDKECGPEERARIAEVSRGVPLAARRRRSRRCPRFRLKGRSARPRGEASRRC
jgi:hypothetical protein